MVDVPAAMDRHLEVIRCRSDGSLIMGASRLTGRYWTGSLWHFQDPSVAPHVEQCTAGVQTEAGIADLQLINDNQLIVASDSGAIEMWQLSEEGESFQTLWYSYAHDSTVHTVSTAPDANAAVSGGADATIKIWDLETKLAMKTLKAHTDTIWCISCSPMDKHVFLSCAQDGRALMWDTRKEKAACSLGKGVIGGVPTCITWSANRQTDITIGCETGEVLMLELRNQSQPVHRWRPHTRTVHRLAYCPQEPSWLATVSDDCDVVVTSLQTDPNIVYQNSDHQDMVRGVSWSPAGQQLHSCGWDTKVLHHKLDGFDRPSPTQQMDCNLLNGETANRKTQH
ncbi:PREDICTED: methylosome protein 50-like [Branchiostoma belcheri]|uniref:Methylosome protein WDR77 n=1 Tax=Branchiostoma belcheri TaxID=7741 RepID=A0A6P4Z9Y0_BRABE|nr:PREDICTED: methylosome protein 50-like [Branchiostoma belcheri]